MATLTTPLLSTTQMAPAIQKMSHTFGEIENQLDKRTCLVWVKHYSAWCCCLLTCPLRIPCLTISLIGNCVTRCFFCEICCNWSDSTQLTCIKTFDKIMDFPATLIKGDMENNQMLLAQFNKLRKYILLKNYIENHIPIKNLTELIISYIAENNLLVEVRKVNLTLQKAQIPFPDELQFMLELKAGFIWKEDHINFKVNYTPSKERFFTDMDGHTWDMEKRGSYLGCE